MAGSALALSLSLVSCGMSKDVSLASGAVSNFHSKLDATKFADIYSGADPDLQKASPSGRFSKFMSAVHQNLGNVKDSSMTDFQVNWTTEEGTVASLTYHTNFEKGAGTESFRWRISGGKALLLYYNVNSDALVEN